MSRRAEERQPIEVETSTLSDSCVLAEGCLLDSDYLLCDNSQMQRLEKTLRTPAENVALDEVLLDWAAELLTSVLGDPVPAAKATP